MVAYKTVTLEGLSSILALLTKASIVFNGSISGFHPEGEGSNPSGRSKEL